MKKLTTPFPQVEGVTSALHFDELLRHHRGGESIYDKYGPEGRNDRRIMGLYLPPFQRPEVWTIPQKRRFIESCLLGLDIGRVVIVHSEVDGKYHQTDGWLIDGQQRLTAVRGFYDGEFTVFNDISFDDIWDGGVDYANDWYQSRRNGQIHRIPPKTHWKRLSFPSIILRNTPPEVLEHLYHVMNYGGTPHE